jgi:hypothetical protein
MSREGFGLRGVSGRKKSGVTQTVCSGSHPRASSVVCRRSSVVGFPQRSGSIAGWLRQWRPRGLDVGCPTCSGGRVAEKAGGEKKNE